MKPLLVLYLVKYCFMEPGGARNRARLRHSQTVPDAVFGPLDVQPLSSHHLRFLQRLRVYLTPVFGGLLADRLLGQRRTVILGA